MGAAAFVLGLSLAGPQTVGVAAADGPDSESSPSSSGSAGRGEAGPARGAHSGAWGRTTARTGTVSTPAQDAPAPAPAATGRTASPAAAIRGGFSSTPVLPEPSRGTSGAVGVLANSVQPQPLPAATATSPSTRPPAPRMRASAPVAVPATAGTSTVTSTTTAPPARRSRPSHRPRRRSPGRRDARPAGDSRHPPSARPSTR